MTDAKVVLCNYGQYRVPADFARELEHALNESRNAERLVRMQLAALRAEIGAPLEGAHPDEAKPRAETWHKERANWKQEVGQLKFELFNRTMEIAQLRSAVQRIEECCDKPSDVWDIANAALSSPNDQAEASGA